MAPPPVIELQGVGKHYDLDQQRAAYGTLRDSLTAAVSPRARRRLAPREIWALRDVDLVVGEGEALGIIGNNGAGKTTLLRILARITQPSTGVSRTRGRVGALLEVGTGFHPELSGRDNVLLSGAVMGMTRADVRRRYDEIVEFAGVGAFMETPLKRYSSGMRLRLAFAVAAHLEPELMLVDEILAVGDMDFQRRCLQRMSSLSGEGRTVVFISHDLGAVTRLCSRAVWIEHGQVREDGDTDRVVKDYFASVLGQPGRVELAVDGDAGVTSVAITDGHGSVLEQPKRSEPLQVEIRLQVPQPIAGLDLAVWILAADGERFLDESWSDQDGMPELAPDGAGYVVRLGIPPVLRAGDYVVGVWLGTELHTYVYQDVLPFTLLPAPDDRQVWVTRPRLVQPPVTWERERIDTPA